MHAEHADASVRLQDRRSRIRFRRIRVAGIKSPAEPWPGSHPRVLRASPCCICAEFLLRGAAGRCWRTHCQARVAAHTSGATPWHSACMAPVLVAANGCAVCSACIAFLHLRKDSFFAMLRINDCRSIDGRATHQPQARESRSQAEMSAIKLLHARLAVVTAATLLPAATSMRRAAICHQGKALFQHLHAILRRERTDDSWSSLATPSTSKKKLPKLPGMMVTSRRAVSAPDVAKRVRNVPRTDSARAGSPNHHIAADAEFEFARHDIEDLGLMPMHVQRRSFAGWDLLLEDRVSTVDLLAPHQHARMPINHPNRARPIVWQRNDRRSRLSLLEHGDPLIPRARINRSLSRFQSRSGDGRALVLLLAAFANAQQHFRPPLLIEMNIERHQRYALARHLTQQRTICFFFSNNLRGAFGSNLDSTPP